MRQFYFYIVYLISLYISLVQSHSENKLVNDDQTSNAYNDFLAYYKRHHTLQISDLNDLTGKLLYKFGCLSKNCDQVYTQKNFSYYSTHVIHFSAWIVVNYKMLELLVQQSRDTNLEMFRLLSCAI